MPEEVDKLAQSESERYHDEKLANLTYSPIEMAANVLGVSVTEVIEMVDKARKERGIVGSCVPERKKP